MSIPVNKHSSITQHNHINNLMIHRGIRYISRNVSCFSPPFSHQNTSNVFIEIKNRIHRLHLQRTKSQSQPTKDSLSRISFMGQPDLSSSGLVLPGAPSPEAPTSAPQASELAPPTKNQQLDMAPKSQWKKSPVVIRVRYMRCCQCVKSTIFLTKPEPDECEYCGHTQCTDCDEWVNSECTVYWLRKC